MSEELLKIAKEIGIENADSLTPKQLAKAVEAAQQKLDASANLRLVAEKLEISTEGLSDEEITAAINAAGDELLHEKATQVQTEILATLSEFLGVEDITTLDLETVKKLLSEKESEHSENQVNHLEVVLDEEEGKSSESYTDSKGREFVFTEDAPAAFRCLGIERTQKEWLEDADSMEILVEGELSFLTLKKIDNELF